MFNGLSSQLGLFSGDLWYLVRAFACLRLCLGAELRKLAAV